MINSDKNWNYQTRDVKILFRNHVKELSWRSIVEDDASINPRDIYSSIILYPS